MARETLDKALTLLPNSAETYFARRIFNQWCLHDAKSALPEFEKAHELQPNNAEYLSHAARIRGQYGDFEIALKYLQEAYTLAPHDLEVLRSLAPANRALLRLDTAEKYYNLGLIDFPDNDNFYGGLINVYLSQNELGKARKILAEADKNVTDAHWEPG